MTLAQRRQAAPAGSVKTLARLGRVVTFGILDPAGAAFADHSSTQPSHPGQDGPSRRIHEPMIN